MCVLLDEYLTGHDIKTVGELGWAGVKNGALLQLAAKEFEVLLTVDRNLEYEPRVVTDSKGAV